MKAASQGHAIAGSSGILQASAASGPAVGSLAGAAVFHRPCGMGSPLALLASFTKFRHCGQPHTTLKYSLAT